MLKAIPLGPLALAGCGRTESPEGATAAVAASAARSDLDEVADRDPALNAARARGEADAQAAMDRYDAAEKERVAEQ